MSQLVETKLWPFQARELDKTNPVGRTILGWDMGTGKTLGGIERDLQMRLRYEGEWQTLIVAPLGTHDQWALKVFIETKVRPAVIDKKNRHLILKAKSSYLIIHYEALRLLPSLKDMRIGHIIFDECHRLKNRNAKTREAARRLIQARGCPVTLMSGSPVDDKPQDIWSPLNLMFPRTYTSYNKFVDEYLEFEDVLKDPNDPFSGVYRKIVGVKPVWYERELPKLKAAGVFSRVTIEEALPDLPPKVMTPVFVDLYPEQRQHYEAFKKDMITWVESLDGTTPAPLIATAVIAKLQRLQQFALTSMRYDPDQDKYFMSMPSSKIDWIVDRLVEDDETEQFVIFSQFKAPLYMLSTALGTNNISNVIYTGNESKDDRDRARALFSQGRARVFLATIGAGGEGVDGLQTGCHTMIFLDRSWRPAQNDQAEGRLYRGGQTRSVQIIKMMARDTIDFERDVRIEGKKQQILQMLGEWNG